MMKPSLVKRLWLPLVGAFVLPALALPVIAEPVSHEQDIVNLRLGQRVKVDDGTCPAGQIKEVAGAKMGSTGIVRTRKCVPRLGMKKKDIKEVR
jgi:hypothetical protein